MHGQKNDGGHTELLCILRAGYYNRWVAQEVRLGCIRLKWFLSGLWLILAGTLAGCASPAPGLSETALPAVQLPTKAVTTAVITAFAPATDTPGLPMPTETITAFPMPSATPALEFAICTPLEDHPLDQLRLILADPYRPPPGKSDARHHGVDFSYYRFGERDTIQGVGVQAVLPGRVAAALADTYPFGNLVLIETESSLIPIDLLQLLGAEPGESLYLFYAHMAAAPALRIGDRVEACQSIGAVGKSGNAVEPHLHLEVRLGPAGAVFTEMGEYFPEASPEQRAAYQLWRTSGVYHHRDPMILINFALDQR